MNTPRQKRYDQTRQKILDTSRKILVKEGLEGLSMRRLAKQIDYSPSAIYKYFKNKEEILQAIREEFWEQSANSEADLSHLPFPERLLAAGRDYLAFADAYPEHYLLVFNSPEMPQFDISHLTQDSPFSGVVDMVREGVEGGYIQLPEGFTCETLAFQLWIMVHGIVMLRLTLMKPFREEFDRLTDKILSDSIRNITFKRE